MLILQKHCGDECQYLLKNKNTKMYLINNHQHVLELVEQFGMLRK